MPELPEVESAVRLLRRAATHKTIARVQLLHASHRRRVSPSTLRALRGATVRSVERRGKHQFLELEDGRTLHVHFRMTGEWTVDTVTADVIADWEEMTPLMGRWLDLWLEALQQPIRGARRHEG